MCICLSLSQEIKSVSGQPAPPSSPHTRHRRSVSDTWLLRDLSFTNLTQRSLHRTLDDSIPLSSSRNSLACKIFTLPVTISSSKNVITIPLPPPLPASKSSIQIPTPPPLPPQPKANKHKIVLDRTFGEEIARYNFYDNLPQHHNASPSSSEAIKSQPVTCSVCFEEAIPKEFIHFFPCMHSFCKECVKEHIKAMVSMGKKISCLYANCKSILPADLAKDHMDEHTYERYQIILRTPAGAHRWCPRPGCDTPYIKADCDSSSPQVKCKNNECSLVFCYDCRVKWHDGASCEQYKEMVNKDKPEEQALSEEYAKQNLQECPNCSIWVEKIDGCEYVMCAACHHEFCWDCLEPHDHNMGAHVHGPRYKPNPRYQRRVRQRRAFRVAKIAGIGVAACVLGPPALALGAAVAVVALPVVGIHALVKNHKRKKAAKERKKRAALYNLE